MTTRCGRTPRHHHPAAVRDLSPSADSAWGARRPGSWPRSLGGGVGVRDTGSWGTRGLCLGSQVVAASLGVWDRAAQPPSHKLGEQTRLRRGATWGDAGKEAWSSWPKQRFSEDPMRSRDTSPLGRLRCLFLSHLVPHTFPRNRSSLAPRHFEECGGRVKPRSASRSPRPWVAWVPATLVATCTGATEMLAAPGGGSDCGSAGWTLRPR